MAGHHAFTCPLPNGIHARPASALEEVARRFRSEVTLTNRRSGQHANAKSVLGIVGLDVRQGDPCLITVAGADEQEALTALAHFLEHEFPACDAPLPAASPRAGSSAVPRLLADAGACWLEGTPVVPGIGRGRVVVPGRFLVPPSIPGEGPADAGAEFRRLDAALETVAAEYFARAADRPDAPEAGMLRAHAGVARDPEFRERLRRGVIEGGMTAAKAIQDVEEYFTVMLLASESALLRERALDVRDVCRQVLRAVYGEAAGRDEVVLEEPSICAAAALTPGQFLSMDRRLLQGLALADGGTTSHTVILARSFAVPTLVGVQGLEPVALEGREAVVDAELGVLFTSVSDPVDRYHQLERRRLDARASRLARIASAPARTSDGVRIEVAANVASATEAESAFEAGAEGIGLFRTEMLFLDRGEPPGEDEQVAHYTRAVAAAAGRRVIIRTLDVGGDKPLPYLRLPREDNPFLGYRAVRLYPAFEPLFRQHVRALVRASAVGPLWVMIPMVGTVEEARWVREVIKSEQAEYARQNLPFDPHMRVGAMIEIPSAALMVDRLARVLDFFSIGSNDLLQYFAAADRANPHVAHLYDALSPAFLRLLRLVVDRAHAAGRWVGLCGEMAGDRRALPVLLGLGLDEISLPAPGIAAVKASIARLSSATCSDLLDRAVASETTADVMAALAETNLGQPVPLLSPTLVLRKAECRDKAEAIKTAVDLLYIDGRTQRPREVEEEVWRREEDAYATDFAEGFAIPHCRTEALESSSLAIVSLAKPVEWSPGGKPVSMVLLLALRESDTAALTHLRVLASLSRRLMHEDFRARLASEEDPEALCRLIATEVGL
jgi:fructose-specific PTS system IIA-like component